MSDPFSQLNDAFRPVYDDLRVRLLAGHRPILFATGDQLVLLRDGGRQEARLRVPQAVDDLKAVAHLGLTCFLLLGFADGDVLSAGARERADALRRRIAEAAATGRVAGPARQLLDESAALLDRALAAGRAAHAEAVAFVRATRPLVDAITDDAARRMLAVLHEGIWPLWSALSADEQARLIVLNIGTKSARNGAQIARYCAWLMGVEGEGERLVFAEGARDEAEALQVLATFLADMQIGLAFDGDPLGFMRDVLGAPTDTLLGGATPADLTSPHPR